MDPTRDRTTTIISSRLTPMEASEAYQPACDRDFDIFCLSTKRLNTSPAHERGCHILTDSIRVEGSHKIEKPP